MCNLYSLTKSQDAMRALFRVDHDRTGNLPTLPGIFPDYEAPIVRASAEGGRELVMARWGMPSSKKALFDAASRRADKMRSKGQEVDFDELLRMEPDAGTTNVRNTSSSHWKRWLGPEHRCLVPFTAFSEFNRDHGGDVWFALGEDRPLACFAGIWTGWSCVRKKSKGWENCQVFAFLTTEPNAEVGAVHPKAMPVILTTQEEQDTWLRSVWDKAKSLQRPLPDRSLVIVARGSKRDAPEGSE